MYLNTKCGTCVVPLGTLVGQVVRTESILGLTYGLNPRGGTCMDPNFTILIHFRKNVGRYLGTLLLYGRVY